MWSARAISSPSPKIACGGNDISWVKNYKYLGYYVSEKLGWGLMIKKNQQKIRQRMNMIRAYRFNGSTSYKLRRTLFSCFVLPLFTWLFAIFPLFTDKQRNDLSHFYYTCLKRISYHLEWQDPFYAFVFHERSLEDRCFAYWERYFTALSESMDGNLLYEQAILNLHRTMWRERAMSIKGLRMSKRFVENTSVLEKCVSWCTNNAITDSVPNFEEEEILLLSNFPETF